MTTKEQIELWLDNIVFGDDPSPEERYLNLSIARCLAPAMAKEDNYKNIVETIESFLKSYSTNIHFCLQETEPSFIYKCIDGFDMADAKYHRYKYYIDSLLMAKSCIETDPLTKVFFVGDNTLSFFRSIGLLLISNTLLIYVRKGY